MNNNLTKSVFIFIFFILAKTAFATTDVSNFFKNLNTFSADFSQIVEQDGHVVQNSKGKVLLKKPLKFVWDYQSPNKMQLLSDGKKFYNYDVDLEQVIVKPVKEIAGSSFITLLYNNTRLNKVFNIKVLSSYELEKVYQKYAKKWLKKATKFYLLSAKQKVADGGQVGSILIGLSENILTLLYIEDSYGKNTFYFYNAKQNQVIADDKFIFKAPKGVDILGN